MTDSTARVLPLFPLEQVVLFPGMALPLRIFEERYKVMIGACEVTELLAGVSRDFVRYQQATLALTGRTAPTKPAEVPADPLRLSYSVASTLYVPADERQRLLETDDVAARLEQEQVLLKREMPRTI